MGSILSLTGAGNCGGTGISVVDQILALDPVMWLRASDPASLISQGALSFLGSANQLISADTACITGDVYSGSLRFKAGVQSALGAMWFSGDKDSAAEFIAILLQTDGSVIFRRRSVAAGTIDLSTALSTYDDDAWHRIVWVSESAASVLLYIDAEAAVTNSTSVTVTGHDRTAFGMLRDSDPTNPFDGELADGIIWDGTALSAGEAADVIAGTIPVTPTRRWFLNDPASPYLDAIGSLDLTAAGNTVQNEQQTITITGTPTGGTFTLTYDGQTTGAIAFNATAATVDTALELLSNIGAGDVTCTGGVLPGTPVVCEFTGALADTDVVEMTADGALLTGGASPDAAVTTTQPGHPVSLPTPVVGPEDTQAVEGSAIEQWVDKTVRDNSPAQPTVIRRPELINSPWSDGSRAAVRCDGVDDLLAEATIDAPVVAPYEMFLVFRFRDLAAPFEVALARANFPRFARTNLNDMQVHDGATSITDGAATLNFEIVNLELNDAATKIIRNSVTDVTGGTTTTDWTDRIIVAAQTAASSGSRTDFLEILFFPSGLLSAEEKSLVLGYLRDEYILYWGDVDYTGPVAHFSASSIGIKTADDGSGDDVADTEAVGYWVDVSENANHVTEATAAQKPAFDLLNSSFDDKSVLAFDGGDNLSVVDPAMDNGPGLTLGFVANITAASADHYLINKAGTYAVWMDSDGEIHVAIGTDGDVFATVLANIDAGIVAGTPFLLVVRYVTTSLKLFVDGVQKGAEVVTVNGDVLDTAADVILGASANDGTDGWDGEMAEAMVFDRGISDTEINNVFIPMGAKYGISVGSV